MTPGDKEANETMQYMKEQLKEKWNEIYKSNKNAEPDHGLISTLTNDVEVMKATRVQKEVRKGR